MSSVASDGYRVYVAQYQRGEDSNRNTLPYHWQICIRTGKGQGPTGRSSGTVFHIIGSHNGWGYERKDNITYSATQNWAGAHFVGTVPKDRIGDIDQVLRTVPLVPNRMDWNCQNWVFSALKALKQKGYQISCPATQADLTLAMTEAYSQWNAGQDSD